MKKDRGIGEKPHLKKKKKGIIWVCSGHKLTL